MTRKLFWVDPYLNNCDTVVESVSGAFVTLKDTVFYAFSGGQESDQGLIGDYPVINARHNQLDIEYELPAGHRLKAGDPVKVLINWPRRYDLMRLHFAAELILELTSQRFQGIEKIGAHISREKARIDFYLSENITPYLPELTNAARLIIDQNLVITSAFSDEVNQRRYWEINGFARVPCGGTHLKRTGEVGLLTLKRNNIGKGKERIEVYVNPLTM